MTDENQSTDPIPAGDENDVNWEELQATEPGASPPALQDPGMAEDNNDEGRTAKDLERVFDIPVNVSAVLGKTHLEVSEILRLREGAVIELDRKVGEAIDIYVNDRLVARGEVVLVEDRLGITMTEIIKNNTSV